MKPAIPGVLLFAIVLTASGQGSLKDKKIVFSSVNQAGLIVGVNKESAMVQTVNGVRKNKWFAGLGFGIDFYVERGVPLFVDIRRDLTEKMNTPFVYLDGGLYCPWLNFIQKEQKLTTRNSAGAYYDIGLGWKLSGKNNRSFLLSAGYTLKQDKGKSTVQIWNPVTRAIDNSNDSYQYNYRRVVLKLGIQL
ncbi:MAG: hypothetical protein M3040_05785 [Bacteroidota bacterium]|nr:hypothetical protein [Bacteroidota bacterium]